MLSLASSEESRERNFSCRATAGFDAVYDECVLQLDFWVCGLETVECGDDIDCVFVAIFCDEPARRFGEEPSSCNEDYAEDDLEGDWESPCQVIWSV